MSEAGRALGPVDGLLSQIRAAVSERRAAGDYPDGLEARLAEHFERVRLHRLSVETDLAPLRSMLTELETRTFDASSIPTASALPLGERYHKAVAKAVSRQVGGVLEQLADYERAQRRLLGALIDGLGPNHRHTDLIDSLDSALDRVEQVARSVGVLHTGVAWYDQLQWAERFEGAYDEALGRARALVAGLPLGAGGPSSSAPGAFGPSLVLEAGRGEIVEALGDIGGDVVGFESLPALAADARRRGLDVQDGEPLAPLAASEDASLGLVVLVRGVARLGPAGMLALVGGARRALRPDGLLVLAPDPQTEGADPRVRAPVDPRYVAFLVEQSGLHVSGPDPSGLVVATAVPAS